MSEVEETLERVKLQSGVEGYVIVDKDGQVLRRLPSMPAAKAEVYAEFMTVLATKARGVVRDLDPKNELRYLRVRAKKAEILVAVDEDFIVVVIQRWTPASSLRGLFVVFSTGFIVVAFSPPTPRVARIDAMSVVDGIDVHDSDSPSLASILRADAATVTTSRRWRENFRHPVGLCSWLLPVDGGTLVCVRWLINDCLSSRALRVKSLPRQR